MSKTIGPAPVNPEASQHLLDALLAQCLRDATAFTTAFDDMQRDWDHDPLGTLASTTLVSAVAKRVVHPGPPLIILASVVGRVAKQGVPDYLMFRAIDVVFRFAEGDFPSFVDAFGADPVAWRQAGAVMAAFTYGLIIANELETNSTRWETIERLSRALRRTS